MKTEEIKVSYDKGNGKEESALVFNEKTEKGNILVLGLLHGKAADLVNDSLERLLKLEAFVDDYVYMRSVKLSIGDRREIKKDLDDKAKQLQKERLT